MKGEYSGRGRRRRDGNGAGGSFNRVDPEIKFEFGTSSPIPEQDALKEVAKRWQRAPLLFVPLRVFRPFSQEFRVTWQGSLFAPETGEYEFLVKTENAAKLSINDMRRPLIDALVKSGSDTEYRGSIYLLGGRAYPIRLELSRSKEMTSSIALEWKIPRRAFEVIPRRQSLASVAARDVRSDDPFPPDDRSAGYERGTSVSKAWDLATTDAAIEVAGYVVGSLEGIVRRERRRVRPCGEASRDFAAKFAERAFRRPLTAEQKAIFIDRQFKDVPDLDTAVKTSGASCPQVTSISLPRDHPRPSLTAMMWPRDSHSGCGIRCPIKVCSKRPLPASWRRTTRWRARPSAWSPTLVPGPSSGASFFNG